METSLACSSTAAAVALFAMSFFSLSALPRISVYRRSTSAAHAAFVIPGGLSLGAPRLPRLWRAIVGDPLRRHGGRRGEEELQLWGISVGKMGICGTFWRETKLMAGNYPSVIDTTGPLNISRIFVLSRVPERASESRGWPGLTGWMKAQIRAKTRNRGCDWAEYRHSDEKMRCRGPTRGDGWRCS
jgi:hypothetical protein